MIIPLLSIADEKYLNFDIHTLQSQKLSASLLLHFSFLAALPGVEHDFNTFLTSQSIEVIKSAFKGAFNMHLYNDLQYGFDCSIIQGHIDNSQRRQGKREPWTLIAVMKSMHSTVTSSTGGNHLEQPAFKTLENSREENKEQG